MLVRATQSCLAVRGTGGFRRAVCRLDVVQIAAAAPKGWGRTLCATLPDTVPPDSVPTSRAPRRSDGSGDIGLQDPQTWGNRYKRRNRHGPSAIQGLWV